MARRERQTITVGSQSGERTRKQARLNEASPGRHHSEKRVGRSRRDAMSTPQRKKRLKRGRDWHGWAFYEAARDGLGMCHWAEAEKPTEKPSPRGRWVRVRFVRVRERIS